MYLSLLYPNPNNAQARKDLADPYAMHQTLSRIAEPEDRVLSFGNRPLWEKPPHPGADSKTPALGRGAFALGRALRRTSSR